MQNVKNTHFLAKSLLAGIRIFILFPKTQNLSICALRDVLLTIDVVMYGSPFASSEQHST